MDIKAKGAIITVGINPGDLVFILNGYPWVNYFLLSINNPKNADERVVTLHVLV